MNKVSMDFSNEEMVIECIKHNILPKYDLFNSEVSMVKFKDTDKQRAVFKIITDEGAFCLKKVYFGINDLLYVYSATEWLFRKNFNVTKLLPTVDNNRFVIYDQMFFILTPWIDGIKCDFDNIKHLILSLRNLANMHKHCQKFTPIKGSSNRTGLDDLYISTLKHFQQLLLTSNLTNEVKDKFSNEFLEHFDNNLIIAEKSLSLASKINKNDLTKSLCHGDYVNKNIIFTNNFDIWVIDFDKCKFDYIAHDIGYLLRRLLKRDETNWDEDLTINLLRNYNEIFPLTTSDFRYILSYAIFPQKYWKISRDYYKNIKKCNKQAFLTLLKKSNKKINAHLAYSKTICERVEREFNINLL